MYVDFLCFDNYVRNQDVSSDTRIVYYISFWPLEAISGGGIYDEGSATQDEITVRELDLKRDEQSLSVNNHSIDPGETYNKIDFIPSFNFWLIFKTRFMIINKGIVSVGSFTKVDVLYVSGGVDEGWIPNPFGLIILLIGIRLFRQGKRDQKHS